jgi:hypothetical protein
VGSARAGGQAGQPADGKSGGLLQPLLLLLLLGGKRPLARSVGRWGLKWLCSVTRGGERASLVPDGGGGEVREEERKEE